MRADCYLTCRKDKPAGARPAIATRRNLVAPEYGLFLLGDLSRRPWSRSQPSLASGFNILVLVLPVRIELTTSPLPRECSTTELRQRLGRQTAKANDGVSSGKASFPCHKGKSGASAGLTAALAVRQRMFPAKHALGLDPMGGYRFAERTCAKQ
jgi:hypothetical protein